MEQITLNLIPKGLMPICHASQYDKGRAIRLVIMDGLQGYFFTDETAELEVRKPDNNIVTAAVDVIQGNSYVDIVTTEQMTACEGDNLCELVIYNGDVRVGSLNFKMRIEVDPLKDGIESETEIHNLTTQVASLVASEVENQYDSANVIFDAEPTAGHGNGYAVTSEGIVDYVNPVKTIENVSIASFDNGADNVPVSSLIVDIDAVQAGSGTPSPSNPRAISGWSECNIHKSGINLWDEEWELGVWSAEGTKKSDNNAIRSKNYIAVVPNLKICLISPVTLVVRELDINKNVVRTSTPSSGQILILSPNTKYIVFCTFMVDNITSYSGGISFNYPSTDTSYHAYNGNTYTVNFGQTVYGGTLKVSTGLLTITHGYIASYNGEPINEPWISSIDEYAPNTSPSTGAEVVYPLSTPTTVQLTPTEIRTLLNNNNIFADTGNINELVYFKASSNGVAKLIEAYSSAENVAFDNDDTDLSSTDVQNGMVELSSKRFAYKNVESSTNVDDLKAQGVYYGNITNMPLLAQGGIVVTTTKPVFTAVQVYPNVVMGTLYVGSQIAIGNSGAMFVRGNAYTPPITTTPPDASDRPASVTWKDWHQVAFWEDILGESINYTSESGTTIYEEIEALKTRLTALGG